MKKTLLLAALACGLTACQSQPQPEPVACPSCNPPVRHFEIVTECSDYKEKDMGNGAYSQCRFCSSRIYSNGVDVTDQFNKSATKKITIRQKRMRTPCEENQ